MTIPSGPRGVVRFNTGVSALVATILIGVWTFVALLAALFFVVGVEYNPKGVVPVAVFYVTVTVVLVAGVLMQRPTDWDLDRRLFVNPRNGEWLPFSAVRRVIWFHGHRSAVRVHLWGEHGEVRGLAWPVVAGTRRQMGREHWYALRTLLEEPGIDGIEFHRLRLDDKTVRKGPKQRLPRYEALRAVDERIALLDSGVRNGKLPPMFRHTPFWEKRR